MSKPFTALATYGFPLSFIQQLELTYGPGLNALQEQVLARHDLLRAAESLVLAAPTASGKTLVAELAVLARVLAGQQALFLVPTKALAEQQARALRRRWQPLGLRVTCTTRERRRDDHDIVSGRVPFVVAVYEKAIGLLARHAAWLAPFGLIVADEVQLLGDPERGAHLDLFLTRWKQAGPARPQLIALSAVLPDPEAVGRWLGIRTFRTDRRPFALREGILDPETGRFSWRDAGDGTRGEEDLLEPVRFEDATGTRVELAHRLATAHGPLVQFCATRGEAVRLAEALAERRPFPPRDLGPRPPA